MLHALHGGLQPQVRHCTLSVDEMTQCPLLCPANPLHTAGIEVAEDLGFKIDINIAEVLSTRLHITGISMQTFLLHKRPHAGSRIQILKL